MFISSRHSRDLNEFFVPNDPFKLACVRNNLIDFTSKVCFSTIRKHLKWRSRSGMIFQLNVLFRWMEHQVSNLEKCEKVRHIAIEWLTVKLSRSRLSYVLPIQTSDLSHSKGRTKATLTPKWLKNKLFTVHLISLESILDRKKLFSMRFFLCS